VSPNVIYEDGTAQHSKAFSLHALLAEVIPLKCDRLSNRHLMPKLCFFYSDKVELTSRSAAIFNWEKLCTLANNGETKYTEDQ